MLKGLGEDVLRAVFVVGETPSGVEHELPEIIRKLFKNKNGSLLGRDVFCVVVLWRGCFGTF